MKRQAPCCKVELFVAADVAMQALLDIGMDTAEALAAFSGLSGQISNGSGAD